MRLIYSHHQSPQPCTGLRLALRLLPLLLLTSDLVLQVSAQVAEQNQSSRLQRGAPFYSIKDGKTSARRIQQEQPLTSSDSPANSDRRQTSSNPMRTVSTEVSSTSGSGNQSPSEFIVSGSGANVTDDLSADVTITQAPSRQIGASSLSTGATRLMSNPELPFATTPTGSSTPSSISMSLDGMVVNSRPRAESSSTSNKANKQRGKSAKAGEQGAKAGRRVQPTGASFVSPGSIVQRNKTSLNGARATGIAMRDEMIRTQTQKPLTQQDHIGFDDERQGQEVKFGSNGMDLGGIDPTSLDLLRRKMAGVTGKNPNDMVLSVMSTADGKEQRLVMIARETLDSLQRIATSQEDQTGSLPARQPVAPKSTTQSMKNRQQSSNRLQTSQPVNSWTASSWTVPASEAPTLAPGWTREMNQQQRQSETTFAPSLTLGGSTQTSLISSSTKRPEETSRYSEIQVSADKSLASNLSRPALPDSFREVAVSSLAEVSENQQQQEQVKQPPTPPTTTLNQATQVQAKTQTNSSPQRTTNGQQRVDSTVQLSSQTAQQGLKQEQAGSSANSGNPVGSKADGKRKQNNGSGTKRSKQIGSSGSKSSPKSNKNGKASDRKSLSIKRPQSKTQISSEAVGSQQLPRQPQQQDGLQDWIATEKSRGSQGQGANNDGQAGNSGIQQRGNMTSNGEPSKNKVSAHNKVSAGINNDGRTDEQAKQVVSDKTPKQDDRSTSARFVPMDMVQFEKKLEELERDQEDNQKQSKGSDGSQQVNAELDALDGLRASIPGEPILDYPIYANPPKTSFDCSSHSCTGGYYADQETQCQVFHICQSDGRFDTFLCPNGTIFSQQHFVCVWWWQVECQQSASFYKLNDGIYCSNSMPMTSLNEPISLSQGSWSRLQESRAVSTAPSTVPVSPSSSSWLAGGGSHQQSVASDFESSSTSSSITDLEAKELAENRVTSPSSALNSSIDQSSLSYSSPSSSSSTTSVSDASDRVTSLSTLSSLSAETNDGLQGSTGAATSSKPSSINDGMPDILADSDLSNQQQLELLSRGA